MTDAPDDDSLPPAPRWPLFVALAAAIAWVVAIAGAIVAEAPGVVVTPEFRQVAIIAREAVLLAAPVALIWLIALRLRDGGRVRAARVALIAEHSAFTERNLDRSAAALMGLETRIAALADRIEAIAAPVEARQAALDAAARALEASGARLTAVGGNAEAAAATLTATTPAAIAQAETLQALLESAARSLAERLAETETLLAGLHVGAADADAQARRADAQMRLAADGASQSIAAITSAANDAQAAIAGPLAQLKSDADAAFARTAAAMDATRDGVHAQTSAMLASVDQARITLAHIGGEAARQIDARLVTLVGNATALGDEIAAQSERANALIDDVSRGFTVLDAKLGNSATTGTTALDAISTRMTEAREAIHRLGEPITATESLLANIEARIAEIGGAADGALERVSGSAPAIEALADRMNDLFERADDLARPLAAGSNSIAEAREQLDRARDALDRAAEQLGQELNTARDTLAEIEGLTGSASLAASTQLIDVFARVRDVANQTAGTMRDALANVVAEAEAALGDAGTRQAEAAFAAPIRAQLAEVEALHDRAAAAGQAAAERVTQRLVALTETVATVESHIDEAEVRHDVRTRNTLARRASLIIEKLQAAAIDIAGLLAFEIEDTAWDDYLKGDKSIFTRRIVAALDGDASHAIGRHLAHDAEFRSEATHYISEFETLISHVLPDREGQTLATTLLSSDIGRLYTALAQAIGRLD